MNKRNLSPRVGEAANFKGSTVTPQNITKDTEKKIEVKEEKEEKAETEKAEKKSK